MAKKKVFISFDYDNDANYKNLLLAWDKHSDFDFEFYNGSLLAAINSDNATYIKNKIRPLIVDCPRLLCLVGSETSKSSWIDWEIEVAVVNNKKLIAVKLDKSYTSPARLLNNGASWAMSFTFDAIKKALDES